MEPRRRLLAPLATPLSSVYFHVKPSAVNHQQTVPTMRYGRYQHVLQMVSFIRYYHFRPDLKDIYCLFSIQWPVLVWPSQRIPICFKSRYMVLGVTFIVLAIFATVMVSSSHIIALIFLWRSFNELFIGTFGLTFGLTFSMSVTIDYLYILCHSYNSLSKVSNLSEMSFSSLKSGRRCPSHSVPRKTSSSDASALGPFLEVFQCLFYGSVSTTARLELSDDSSIALHCQEDFCYISKFSESVW